MDRTESWERVTDRRPCPVCGRKSYCGFLPSGRAVHCTKVSSGHPTSTGWTHYADGDRTMSESATKSDAAERAKIVERIRQGASQTPQVEFGRIASYLLVPLGQVEAMGGIFLGWDGETGEAWDGFPMWSPDPSGSWGWCGWSRRYAGGKKKSVGKSGLFLTGQQPVGDILYVVEGYSDVLAMAGAGLPAVGRPSNIAGSDLIVKYVQLHRKWKAVVVVAENDEKPDGLWPGGTGSVVVADRVRAALKSENAPVPVFARRMPEPFKDPREWFRNRGYSRQSVAALNSFLCKGVPQK